MERGQGMCGRFFFFGNNQERLESLGVVSAPPLMESYNICPYPGRNCHPHLAGNRAA